MAKWSALPVRHLLDLTESHCFWLFVPFYFKNVRLILEGLFDDELEPRRIWEGHFGLKYGLEINKFNDLFEGFEFFKLGNIALEAKSDYNFVIENLSEDFIEFLALTQGDKINNGRPVLPVTQLEDARALCVVEHGDSRSPLSVNPDNLGIL